eukprot:scpid77433/ scgid6396/ 
MVTELVEASMELEFDSDTPRRHASLVRARPVHIISRIARHFRKLGVSHLDVFLLVVHAMLFAAALLGLGLVTLSARYMLHGVDIYQYSYGTQEYKRAFISNCLCPGLLSIITAVFFLIKKSRRQRKASLKHRSPITTAVALLLLLLELVTSIGSMVMASSTVGAIQYMQVNRYTDFGDQCDYLPDLSQCHCRMLYVTGVDTCSEIFDLLPALQNLVAIFSALIVILVSSCLVITLSCSLATLPHHLHRQLGKVWRRLHR